MNIDWVIMDLLDGGPISNLSDFDMISIRDLCIRCFIGVYQSERKHRQDLHIDIDLSLDTSQAARTGYLSQSVDYAQLSQALAFILENAHFELLETAADSICHFILKGYQAFSPAVDIRAVTVRLRKPKALPGFAYPAITLHRKAEDHRLYSCADEKNTGLKMVYSSSSHRLAVLHVPPLASLNFRFPANASLAILKELSGMDIAVEHTEDQSRQLEIKNHEAELVRWLVLYRSSRSIEGFDFDFDFVIR